MASAVQQVRATRGAPSVMVEKLSVSFRRRRVLHELDFSAHAGQLTAIVGENGGGKSTLLKALAGFLRPDAGRVQLAGASAYCPQGELLYPYLTPVEHFQLFAAGLSVSAALAREQSERLFEQLDFAGYRQQLVRELSGGTRQKLNLALALFVDAPILLLDEPYTGFDAESYARFWTLLERERERGKTIVMVAHLVLEQNLFDRVLTLRQGRLHGPA
jgi:ABC-type multidrug transport system ATPase subunit